MFKFYLFKIILLLYIFNIFITIYLSKIMNNIKNKFITNISIYNIIKNIKKSKNHAYIIGTELSYISYLLYDFIHNDNNKDLIFNNNFIYNELILNNEFLELSIAKYFSKNILYFDFFKKFSLKLEKIDQTYLFTFFRGYYINHYLLYSSNLQYSFLDNNYFILYDFHSYFLYIIYKIMNSSVIQNKIKFLLNYDHDLYSINDYIDMCEYKLIFIHKHKYFNNSIKNILNLLYNNIKNTNELYNKEDELLYNIYSTYLLTDINN